MKLFKGYYAVGDVFVPDGTELPFDFHGETYNVVAGENYFTHFRDAYAVANELPTEKLIGAGYIPETPTVIFSAGTFVCDGDAYNKDITLLGNNFGTSPNGENQEENPDFSFGATILWGLEHHGVLYAFDEGDYKLFLDGFILNQVRFCDERKANGKYYSSFKNIKIIGDCRWNVFKFNSPDKKGYRELYFSNIRFNDCDVPDCEFNFLSASANKITLNGIVYENNNKNFGTSNFNKKLLSVPESSSPAEFTLSDCHFKNVNALSGISFVDGENFAPLKLAVKNCSFINACKKGDSVFYLWLKNKNSTCEFTDCTFSDDRKNTAPAITVSGKTLIEFNGCTVSGFNGVYGERKVKGDSEIEDVHQYIKEVDLSSLNAVYEGRKAFFGDMHAHSDSGGISDGHLKLKDWPKGMKEKGIDFSAIVDHEQMRQTFLPEFDNNLFLCGSEPGTRIKSGLSDKTKDANLHYIMLFPDNQGLIKVMEKYPEFNFHGTPLDGCFGTPEFSKEEFIGLARFIKSIGGALIIPHPKQIMVSTEPSDYYFEETHLETIYSTEDSFLTACNYKLWTDLLAMGKKLYTSGGTDTHDDVSDQVVCAIYSKSTFNKELFSHFIKGDLTVGSFGIKMELNGFSMGSSVKAKEGDVLKICVADSFMPRRKKGDEYEFRVYSDRGLCYAEKFDGKVPLSVGIKISDRKFYRAEVYNLTHDHICAVGNPIFIEK